MTAGAYRFSTGEDGGFFCAGAGRWLYWRIPGMPEIRVRVEPRSGGRLVAATLWMAAPARGQLRARNLRDVHLGQLEAVLINPDVHQMILNTTEPDLAPTGEHADRQLAAWADSLPLMDTPEQDLSLGPTIRANKPLFYELLQTIYSRQAQRSRHPARDIAEQNAVTEGSVHRWLWEARRFRQEVEAQRRKAEKRFDSMLAAKGLSYEQWIDWPFEDDYQAEPPE